MATGGYKETEEGRQTGKSELISIVVIDIKILGLEFWRQEYLTS